MKRFLTLGAAALVVLGVLVASVGSSLITPFLHRKVGGATGALGGWNLSDDLVGVAQFAKAGRAVFVTRFTRKGEQYFRVATLDLATGKILSQTVLDDRGIRYLGQSEDVSWWSGASGELHARGLGGEVVATQSDLVEKNPSLDAGFFGGLLHKLGDSAFVDSKTGALFLPREGKGVLVDAKTLAARPASEMDVERQRLSGTVPIAKLASGEMLTPVRRGIGIHFGINGKPIGTDDEHPIYNAKYLIDSKTGALIEIEKPGSPRSILVLHDTLEDATVRAHRDFLSRIALDGRVLWSQRVREPQSYGDEALKVVSAGIHGKNLVLFIAQHDKGFKYYYSHSFTPYFALAMDMTSGAVVWKTHL